MRTILILFMLVLVACGPSARQRAIRTTYDATIIATDQLASYSAKHKAAIVGDATSATAGQAELVSWRAKVDHAEKVLATVYRAIATAALVNDDRSVAVLVQVAAILSAELHSLGVL